MNVDIVNRVAGDLVSPVMGILADLDLSTKYLADRALWWAVGGQSLTNLPKLLAALPKENAITLREYAMKVLARMKEEDDEDNDDEEENDFF